MLQRCTNSTLLLPNIFGRVCSRLKGKVKNRFGAKTLKLTSMGVGVLRLDVFENIEFYEKGIFLQKHRIRY